mmetsp:Transcript_21109/g.63169  ORF Transcript_21109/g.63169 Transcript_21109/m.63169 type:complete len:207 (+) Transcript_21109:644-1264(+)
MHGERPACKPLGAPATGPTCLRRTCWACCTFRTSPLRCSCSGMTATRWQSRASWQSRPHSAGSTCLQRGALCSGRAAHTRLGCLGMAPRHGRTAWASSGSCWARKAAMTFQRAATQESMRLSSMCRRRLSRMRTPASWTLAELRCITRRWRQLVPRWMAAAAHGATTAARVTHRAPLASSCCTAMAVACLLGATSWNPSQGSANAG